MFIEKLPDDEYLEIMMTEENPIYWFEDGVAGLVEVDPLGVDFHYDFLLSRGRYYAGVMKIKDRYTLIGRVTYSDDDYSFGQIKKIFGSGPVPVSSADRVTITIHPHLAA